MTWDAILWLVGLVLFLMAEAATVAVVSLWFAAGSLVAMVAAILGAPFWLQGLLFGGVSVALLLLLRPILKKYFTPRLTKTNVDAVIGMQGFVTVPIDNLHATGTVKLNGMEWTARSTSGASIPEGTLVRVDKVEGVKAFVTPVPVNETVS
jgi:membrane protein implicated in regulation of membrane protease activity